MEPGYRDLSRLTQILLGLLILGFLINLASEYSSWLQLQLLIGGPYSDAEATANDAREWWIARTDLIVLIITAVTFCFWIVRAHRNLPPLGGESLDVTPGWAVGYFFVPILNLWRPYMAMRTLWQASRNAPSWDLEDAPWWLIVWWVCWLSWGLLTRLARPLGETYEDVVRATEVALIIGVVRVALYLLAALVVHSVWTAQTAQHRARGIPIGDPNLLKS